MTTITEAQRKAIEEYVQSHYLVSGLGNEHAPCSVAAINLALTGQLTDAIPDCMSVVIGAWIVVIQDAMPEHIRNSESWKGLLPLAAGTGRVPVSWGNSLIRKGATHDRATEQTPARPAQERRAAAPDYLRHRRRAVRCLRGGGGAVPAAEPA